MKSLLREEIKKKRLLLPENEVKAKSIKIVKKLWEIIPKEAEIFMFYAPFKKEVDLLPFARKLLSIGKRVVFPRVSEKDIIPLEIFSLKDLSPGYLSILEPPLEYSRVVKKIDVVFVPGIVFDLHCFRIGYGGGFYDRFLAKQKVRTKIGICFDFQIVERVPRDPFDIPMDVVVSEKREIRRNEWS
ncbi:5-formyltetrahydrofolate cyclo-ligase [Desulfurobacterium thermolithotrophum]|uniref:5-formyltetrahydrofolate cyclo-ligase n=1 Tax=Desulfurobacterium thermolithotrophum TaxID=64160 RepID=UPI0013D0DA9B|nr:5-formyltetrahydrofolate cyclo-ligase [Desulfurobacterium thermolithotrophum]